MQNYKKGMENIGDWLYLIFIAVAVIASMIKPKKKQEKPPVQSDNNDREPWESTPPINTPQERKVQESPKQLTWEEILKSLKEETKKPVTQTQPVKKVQPQVVAQKKKVQPFLSGERTIRKKIPVSSSITDRIKKFSDGKSIYDNDITASNINIDFSNKDEIKKAVIYSEIFNRRF